jgi:hypothetical protein
MENLYGDPRFTTIREELRHKLLDWLLMTTRPGNTWPYTPPGADGKSTLEGLGGLIAEGQTNYI